MGTLTSHSWIHYTVGWIWNRWTRLSCYYNRVYISCPLYTHVCHFL